VSLDGCFRPRRIARRVGASQRRHGVRAGQERIRAARGDRLAVSRRAAGRRAKLCSCERSRALYAELVSDQRRFVAVGQQSSRRAYRGRLAAAARRRRAVACRQVSASTASAIVRRSTRRTVDLTDADDYGCLGPRIDARQQYRRPHQNDRFGPPATVASRACPAWPHCSMSTEPSHTNYHHRLACRGRFGHGACAVMAITDTSGWRRPVRRRRRGEEVERDTHVIRRGGANMAADRRGRATSHAVELLDALRERATGSCWRAREAQEIEHYIELLDARPQSSERPPRRVEATKPHPTSYIPSGSPVRRPGPLIDALQRDVRSDVARRLHVGRGGRSDDSRAGVKQLDVVLDCLGLRELASTMVAALTQASSIRRRGNGAPRRSAPYWALLLPDHVACQARPLTGDGGDDWSRPSRCVGNLHKTTHPWPEAPRTRRRGDSWSRGFRHIEQCGRRHALEATRRPRPKSHSRSRPPVLWRAPILDPKTRNVGVVRSTVARVSTDGPIASTRRSRR